MLAGVGGIDCVLLVVAADESVMPQTREHFDICRLLRVPRGVVVLTKTDLADADMRALVRLEVASSCRGRSSKAPDRRGVGDAPARASTRCAAALAAQAAGVAARPADGAARLPIDRVFSMKGFGTVVTGTLVSGRMRRGRRADRAARRAARESARRPGARHGRHEAVGRAAHGDQPWRRRGRRRLARRDAGCAGHARA